MAAVCLTTTSMILDHKSEAAPSSTADRWPSAAPQKSFALSPSKDRRGAGGCHQGGGSCPSTMPPPAPRAAARSLHGRAACSDVAVRRREEAGSPPGRAGGQ
eukprot:CAMPEP_0179268004 /NCGR_PEP_ID=MMETSP0797-20121207/30218_1 /TAXON_ID=47934 /ORGANISM="Dinophysis acuminata, Strain DAEP01" /LENGTH=101 /DNA_ID=CAMNT_0020976275 /DNA_START=13 /DNA_END=318 /DNA_ORIENTATION=+